MPSVKIRHTDGTWRAINDGKLQVSWGGAWVTPSTMKIAWAGVWRDTGYAGFPADPVNVHLTHWDYNDTIMAWSPGSGGAAVADYHVVQTDVSGNWLRQYTVAGTTSPAIPVSQSTKYRLYVRARSAANLFSNWGPSIGTSIGKPAVTTYTTEEATRPWSLAASVNGYKDAIVGVGVATNRVVQNVRYQISAYSNFTSALTPYNNREIYRIANSGQYERFSWLVGSIDTTVNVGDYWGNGGVTGMICRGAGWASTASSSIYRAVGTITASGYETYSYQQAHTTAAVANSYW